MHATPAVHNGVVIVAGCDESLRAFNVADGKELFRIVAGANTAASPVIDGDRAYVGTFNNEVLAFDLRAKKIVWRYENTERQFPFYSSAALVGGRVIVGSRDKLVHAHRCRHRQAGVDVHHPGARRLVAGRRRRPDLHRVERRPLLRAERRHRPEGMGVRRRRGAHRLAGDRGGPDCDWVDRRSVVYCFG